MFPVPPLDTESVPSISKNVGHALLVEIVPLAYETAVTNECSLGVSV